MNNPEKPSFEMFLRKALKEPLNRLGGALLRVGIRPNHITFLGLAGSLVAAILAGQGHLLAAGLVLVFFAPLDALDGAMARLMGKPRPFGGFLDSVVDRYEELLMLGGLLVFFLARGNTAGVLLSYAAAAGSVLVSYTRARAESAGFNGKVGLLTRVERSILIILGLIAGYPIVSVGIIAVLGNFTAIQRFVSVWKQSRESVENQTQE